MEVEVSVKAKRIWITVEEPGCGDRLETRSRRDEALAFEEAVTLIEEAEARLRETPRGRFLGRPGYKIAAVWDTGTQVGGASPTYIHRDGKRHSRRATD